MCKQSGSRPTGAKEGYRQIFLNFFFSLKKCTTGTSFISSTKKIGLEIIFPDHPLRKEAYLD